MERGRELRGWGLGKVRGQKTKSQNFFMTHGEREDVIFDVQITFIWPPCKHLKACMDHK